MEKNSLVSVILFGLCAAVWSIKAVFEIISKPYPTDSILLFLDILCAIAWIIAFVVQINRYRSKKDQ